MESKEDIFDWVITFEDEALKRVREEVIKTAEYNFGKLGREVAERYYRQIDGEEEFDDTIKDDCDECKEKAKKLIDIMNLLKECNDNLTSDKINSYFVDFDFDKNNFCDDFLKIIDKYVDIIKQNTCLKIDEKTKNELYRRVLLEAIKRIPENDHQNKQKV